MIVTESQITNKERPKLANKYNSYTREKLKRNQKPLCTQFDHNKAK